MAFLTDADRKYKTPEDICAHLGDEYDKFFGAIVPPIFQNSLFVQPTDVNGVYRMRKTPGRSMII
jgi:cystathionine beta-lyase/cystathionine gamma-synthase